MSYDGETLTVEIQGSDFVFARVLFRDPIGFRVMDEVDLCSFWSTYSKPNGWLYEVESGGWMELETSRPGFCSPEMRKGLREYFLVDDKCINVLVIDPPEIVNLGPDPENV